MSAPAPRFLTTWAHARVYLLPALLVLALGLFRLFGGTYKVDTALYAGVGLQMFRDGGLWTPMAGDLPYFNKPPLVLWIHGLFLHLFGVDLWVVRLPQIVAAAGCAVLTTAIARLLSGPKVGLLAGLIFAASYPVWVHLHRLVLDYWLVLFLLTGVWMCVVGALRGREWWVIGAGVPIGLAMLCKPLFPMLALPVLGLWMVLAGHGRTAGWVGVAMGVALLVSLPWHLSMTALHREVFLDQYFGREVFDRGSGGGTFPSDPWWTYLSIIGLRFMPWTLALAAGLGVIVWRLACSGGRCARATSPGDAGASHGRGMSREWQGIVLCVLWSAAWLVLLSLFFADKRDRYMLHVWPSLSWIAAMWIVHWSPGVIRRVDSRWWGRAVGVLLAAGVLGAATGAIPQKPTEAKWRSLYRWLEQQRMGGHAPEVWNASLAPAEAAQVYLDAGVWPRAIWHGGSLEARIPPEDAIVLFDADHLARLSILAGQAAEPIFESGPDREHGPERAIAAVRWRASWNEALRSEPAETSGRGRRYYLGLP